MHTIAREFFLETSVHTLTAEVTELIYAGQLEGRKGLPRCLAIPGVGNGNEFVPFKIERNDAEDLLFVKYRQVLGCMEVIIFND